MRKHGKEPWRSKKSRVNRVLVQEGRQLGVMILKKANHLQSKLGFKIVIEDVWHVFCNQSVETIEGIASGQAQIEKRSHELV
eukprot:22444_5